MTGGKSCNQESLLSAYVDRELAEDAAVRFELHLAGCRRCSSSYEVMKTNDRLLRQAMPAVEPPAFLKARLLREIESGNEGHSNLAGLRQLFSLSFRSWAYACAPIVLLAIVISAFQIQQRIEHGKILAQIDHSRAEWVAHNTAANPFDIDVNGAPLQATGNNPFDAYLDQH